MIAEDIVVWQLDNGKWVIDSRHVCVSTTGRLYAKNPSGRIREITDISKDDIYQVTGHVTMADSMASLEIVGGVLNVPYKKTDILPNSSAQEIAYLLELPDYTSIDIVADEIKEIIETPIDNNLIAASLTITRLEKNNAGICMYKQCANNAAWDLDSTYLSCTKHLTYYVYKSLFTTRIA